MIDWLIDDFNNRHATPPSRSEVRRLADRASQDVVRLIREDRKLEALYLFREDTGATLRQALAVITWLDGTSCG